MISVPGLSSLFSLSIKLESTSDLDIVEWTNFGSKPGGVLPYITYTGMCHPTGS